MIYLYENNQIITSTIWVKFEHVFQQNWSCLNSHSKWDISGPFHKHGLTLIPAWISNYTHYTAWGEITYPFLNFNGATVEV